tara:strand:- start:227 stop:466 length:240 start_codon:yes stop_codon:yes gene_type:complete
VLVVEVVEVVVGMDLIHLKDLVVEERAARAMVAQVALMDTEVVVEVHCQIMRLEVVEVLMNWDIQLQQQVLVAQVEMDE